MYLFLQERKKCYIDFFCRLRRLRLSRFLRVWHFFPSSDYYLFTIDASVSVCVLARLHTDVSSHSVFVSLFTVYLFGILWISEQTVKLFYQF